MNAFPRTEVGGVSLPRMIVGTNWFCGFSHCTVAKNNLINDVAGSRESMSGIMEVFFRAGVNAVMGLGTREPVADAIKAAEDRSGVEGILISTPQIPVSGETLVHGFRTDEVARILDAELNVGAKFCMPHTSTTDAMVDKCTREVRRMDELCAMIRERGMIPGLSTHLPETIIYADETNLDVETYISIFNAMGFLMPLEVDWTAKVIHGARKPVMTIKPMAAGQIRPFQALNFVWNTIRPQDMVTVGTLTPDEAKELIDLSLSILQRREGKIELQETRSKASVKPT